MKVQELNIQKGNYWLSGGLRDIKSIWFDLVIDKQITWEQYETNILLDHRVQQEELQKYDYQRFNVQK